LTANFNAAEIKRRQSKDEIQKVKSKKQSSKNKVQKTKLKNRFKKHSKLAAIHRSLLAAHNLAAHNVYNEA
jgi:hypothetical protein|tara:strand:- start:399 stop:611 length:213 start_codon:yes stop_codon:yes gene_type:complete